MNGLAAKRDEGPGGHGAGGPASDALGALASAARRVEAAAAAGSPRLLAGALARLTEATQAAEELARWEISVRLIAEAEHAAGFAAGAASRHLRAVR